MLVADIAGKYDFFRIAVLRQPDFDAGRAQQMSDIRKTDFYSLAYFHDRIVMAGNEPADHTICILHGIQRLHHCIIRRTFCLTILPFRFGTLDMCTVTQHNTTQIRCSIRGIDLSSEASGIQKRQKTRMIHMSMSQEYIINHGFRHRQRHIFKYIDTLLHTVVH